MKMGRDVIGPDNFLDDLLKVVNATNAAAGLGQPYPTIDRESAWWRWRRRR